MSHPVKLTPLAERDVAEAFDYYEGKKEHLGFEFVEEVDRAIQRVSEHPLSHRKVIDDARRIGLERFPYYLWFTVEADGSLVIACLHAKRHPRLARERLLGRKPQGRSPGS